MKTIHAEIPDQLYKMANLLVEDGWFRDINDIFSEAVRRFIESHREELMEKFIMDDVKWGLQGND